MRRERTTGVITERLLWKSQALGFMYFEHRREKERERKRERKGRERRGYRSKNLFVCPCPTQCTKENILAMTPFEQRYRRDTSVIKV